MQISGNYISTLILGQIMFMDQIYADRAIGYDFVAYHSYAKRRFNSLLPGDFFIFALYVMHFT